MPVINTVLVTGVSGFRGSQVVDLLLDQGYTVRGTARAGSVSLLLEAYKSFGDRFSIARIDDIASSDISPALKGVDAVIHVASPIPVSSNPADTPAVLKGAIDGTVRVLEAASAASVSKVVITSSIVALASPEQIATSIVIGESDVSPSKYEDAFVEGVSAFSIYCISKALADKATWEYAKAHPQLDVTAIYPPYIFGTSGRGQVIDAPVDGSNRHVYTLIDGPKGRPVNTTNSLCTFINVKDAARAHVNALKLPKSEKPKRIVPNAGEYTWAQGVRHLEAKRPELKDRLPVVEGDGPAIPPHATFDNSSALQVGLEKYISFEETVEDVIDDAVRREKALGLTPA